MRDEARMNEEADRREKERIDKLNAADSLIFQTEKQLKEFGDKLPADKKSPIEQALSRLKEAHKSQDIPAIDNATAELNRVWQAASEELYKASQSAGQQQQAQQSSSSGSATGGKDQEVTDVDFEEVK
jgi:molecular chaperone DnaK